MLKYVCMCDIRLALVTVKSGDIYLVLVVVFDIDIER